MDAKLSSSKIMSAAFLAASEPAIPMAIPISAFLRAGESFTPSPVTATTASCGDIGGDNGSEQDHWVTGWATMPSPFCLQDTRTTGRRPKALFGFWEERKMGSPRCQSEELQTRRVRTPRNRRAWFALLPWAPHIHSCLGHRFDQPQTENILGKKSQKVPKVTLEFATRVPSTHADSMQMKWRMGSGLRAHIGCR